MYGMTENPVQHPDDRKLRSRRTETPIPHLWCDGSDRLFTDQHSQSDGWSFRAPTHSRDREVHAWVDTGCGTWTGTGGGATGDPHGDHDLPTPTTAHTRAADPLGTLVEVQTLRSVPDQTVGPRPGPPAPRDTETFVQTS